MAKTDLMSFIERAYNLAELSSQKGMPSVNEIFEWRQLKDNQEISRRSFIKNSINSGLILSSLPTLLNRKTKSNLKVAIIGAGMAGLNAAYTFYKNNFSENFKIFEASGRIGGRIYTERLNNNEATTELGGEFIDSTHTDMLNLAQTFGLQILDTKLDTLIPDLFLIDGRKYSMADAIKSFQKIRKKIGNDSKLLSDRLVKLDNTPLNEYINSLDGDSWFLKTLSAAYTGECGLDVNELSSLNLIGMMGMQKKGELDLYGKSDERFKIKGGNHQLCEKISNLFRDQIHLNSSLLSIQNRGKGFLMIFSNNEEVYSDYVIMTIPFSILKNIEGIDKLEGISSEKIKCINELGYGTNGKYLIEFNDRTWRSLGYNGSLYGDIIQNGWDSFHMQNNNQGKSIYTIYLGGRRGMNIAKGGEQQYIQELNNAFESSESMFTGFSVPFNWSNNKFSKGSYNCIKVGQRTSLSKHVNTPIKNLLFAGEHCSQNFGGFMNGAAETGRIAAETIINIIK